MTGKWVFDDKDGTETRPTEQWVRVEPEPEPEPEAEEPKPKARKKKKDE